MTFAVRVGRPTQSPAACSPVFRVQAVRPLASVVTPPKHDGWVNPTARRCGLCPGRLEAVFLKAMVVRFVERTPTPSSRVSSSLEFRSTAGRRLLSESCPTVPRSAPRPPTERSMKRRSQAPCTRSPAQTPPNSRSEPAPGRRSRKQCPAAHPQQGHEPELVRILHKRSAAPTGQGPRNRVTEKGFLGCRRRESRASPGQGAAPPPSRPGPRRRLVSMSGFAGVLLSTGGNGGLSREATPLVVERGQEVRGRSCGPCVRRQAATRCDPLRRRAGCARASSACCSGPGRPSPMSLIRPAIRSRPWPGITPA